MKKFTWLDTAALIVWLLPIVYLIYIYPSLSATVPMHYGVDGKPDSYGNKGEFLIFQLIMVFAVLLIYLLLRFLPAIDPKKKVKFSEDTFKKLALGIVTFLSALNIAIIFAALHHEFKMDKLLFPSVALLFAFMGNIMHTIKPNYFAGVRTPWTLESEDTWRATHRLAGKLWFAGGIILTIIMLIIPPKPGNIVFMCAISVMVLVPVIYSYIYFKKHPVNQNS